MVLRVFVVVAADAELFVVVDLDVGTMEPTQTVQASALCPLWHVLVPCPVPDTVVLVGQHAWVAISEVVVVAVVAVGVVVLDVVSGVAQSLVL